MVKDILQNHKIKLLIIASFILGGFFYKSFHTVPHLNKANVIEIFLFSFFGIFIVAYINCKFNLYFFLKPKYLIVSGIMFISASVLPLLIGIINNDKYILDVFFYISSGFGMALAGFITLLFC